MRGRRGQRKAVAVCDMDAESFWPAGAYSTEAILEELAIVDLP